MGALKLTDEQAKRLGQWLKKARRDRGMEQEDLARATGYSRETIGQIERGQNPWKNGPNVRTIREIERALEGVRFGTMRAVAYELELPQDDDDELREVLTQLGEIRELMGATGQRVADLERRVTALEQ